MIELQVRKFGNSLGVVLPKEVINRLHTGEGEPLFLIEAASGTYQLTPHDPEFEKKWPRPRTSLAATGILCTRCRSDGSGLDRRS